MEWLALHPLLAIGAIGAYVSLAVTTVTVLVRGSNMAEWKKVAWSMVWPLAWVAFAMLALLIIWGPNVGDDP
jgi:hypothetical protein